jgi:hypothetical protein
MDVLVECIAERTVGAKWRALSVIWVGQRSRRGPFTARADALKTERGRRPARYSSGLRVTVGMTSPDW